MNGSTRKVTGGTLVVRLKQATTRLLPRQIAAIDAIGALMSAVILGGLLPFFEHEIGLTREMLLFLASVGVTYFLFSAYSWYASSTQWPLYLKTIGFGNLIYCGLTIGVIIHFSDQLTTLGFAYFIIDAAIILCLSVYELERSVYA